MMNINENKGGGKDPKRPAPQLLTSEHWPFILPQMQSTAEFCAELREFCSMAGVTWPAAKDIDVNEKWCRVLFSASFVVFEYAPANTSPYRVDSLRARGIENAHKYGAIAHLLTLL